MPPDEQPLIAGLRLTWRSFRASSGEDWPGDDAFGLWAPDHDLDDLVEQMTQAEFERSDERLPYFAAIWPSATSLVAKLLAGPRLDGKDVLDLGCGLGACGFAAAVQGARVTFFDWEPRAIEIAATSAREQSRSLNTFTFVVGDWRNPPPLGPFDLILGADLLYEQRNVAAVAAFFAQHLKPGAEAWIADPGRPHARDLPALARGECLHLVGSEILPALERTVEVTLLRLRRP